MTTRVSQKADLTVNVFERSVTATVNWVFQLALRIASLRGLSPQYLIDKRQIIEDGLFTWLAEQSLQSISLEVSDPGSADARERFDSEFHYCADVNAPPCQPNMAALEEFCRTLSALPSGAEYRIVVTTAPGATEVAGWYPYEFRPLNVEREQLLSDHGLGNIGTQLIYRGRAS